MWETISTIANLVLGGGLVVSLATLRSTRRKARAESESEYMELSKVYVHPSS